MNENNVTSFFNENNGKTFKDKNGQSVKLNLTSLDVFKEKMSTKVKRLDTFNKMWNVLGLNLFGKYNDFEKKYGTPTSTVGNGENIKKLIDIDDDIEETTNPNQGVKVVSNKIRVFYNDGRFVSRTNLNNINDKTNEITGIWYFVGNDDYQIKYDGGGNTTVIDFKSNTKKIVSDKPFVTPTQTQTTTGIKPILQKLMKIDSDIKKTTSPDQVVVRAGEGVIFIFFSDGNFRYRLNSVNNKNGELTGRWKFLGENDYQVNVSDGDVYTFSKGWKSIEKTSSSGTMGKTWKEVTFTLEDVLAGKAVLKRGMKGKAVEDLQKLMIDMNFSKVSKSGEPDGKYGKLTELSIRQFQGEMPYGEQDGKVGQRTLKRMYYVFNYDPDKEVDDEQPQVPTGDDSPEFLQSQLDTQNADKVNSTTSSQPETQTTTAQPATQAQPDTTTQPKKKLTLSPINEQENNEEIVSQKVKSLQLSDIYKGV
jgi:peptidoglycan hydrolase-like protein with peptidoglycan-binding domain